ncbi:hypothetical protein BJX76DRAFT_363661 [Aspergillus varians]
MVMRHIEFDMNELVKCAAESIGLAPTQCARIDKFPDGMFNKTFLFTMQDGTQVVGKVPNPNAGRAHYTTASEVATMDFVRNTLHTPVPKILTWSSKAGESPVRAEYIIMEKVAGVQLHEVWPKMDIKERFELVKTISGLYYSVDIDGSDRCGLVKGDGSVDQDHQFTVGPSTGRKFLDDGRIALDFDRGPWNTAEQYKSAVGLREIACVRNISHLTRSPISLYGPGTYTRSRTKKIVALQNYLRLVKYLLPTNESLKSAFLWHPDLHAENIFVHPERPSEVVGIIDWQSSEVLPICDHARQPYFLDYDGPPSTALDPPAFPDNFDQLDPAEQARAQDLYLKMSLSTLYRRFTFSINKPLFKAMEFRQTVSFEIMLFAQNLLVDGEALYQSRCLDLEKEWASLPGVQASGNPPFPLQFTAAEADSIEEDASNAVRGMELMQSLRQSLGELWPEKGVVRPEQYDDAKRGLKLAKAELIERLACSEAERVEWEKSWPFDE